MAEEIGEAMNQEYGESDLSERRRKRSARGINSNVLTGGFEIQNNKEAADKMREIVNQTELHNPNKIMSDIS